MKIILCTTPIRSEPTSYPPFGSMQIIQSLRAHGYDPYFYDIDGLRPEFEEVLRFFEAQNPDVIGISAVVSTAYDYTKTLTLALRKVCPNAKIVVGGNLAASAELLVRKCGVDVCAIGEGELVMLNLVKHWEDADTREDYSRLNEIKSISYLNENDELTFTGYDIAIPAEDFTEPDFEILETFSNIDNYIVDPLDNHTFTQDPRSYQPHRKGKKAGNVVTAKGCVARCTFCHRWDRGYRHMSIDTIMNKVQYLVERYNVGFILFADENFGSDRRKLDELIERIRPLDILWSVGGMRCRSVDPDLLKRMKESGCVGVFYGIESGSQRILDVMEKNSSRQLNLDVCKWTHEAGLYTVYQLILAMPGEDRQTISETDEFIQAITEYLPSPPNERLSINYIQALPGTPVYEYARSTGLIGPTLDDEEEYLIRISDTDAVDDAKTLNFTQYDYLTMQSWRPRLVFNAEANWYQKRGWKAVEQVTDATRADETGLNEPSDNDFEQGGYFRLGHIVYRNPKFYRLLSMPVFFPIRMMYPAIYVLIHDYRLMSKKQLVGHIGEFLKRIVIRRRPLKEFISLRKVMEARTVEPENQTEESMLPLRSGR